MLFRYAKLSSIYYLNKLSFFNRLRLGELLFGETRNDEINIAFSLLKVISKIPNEDRKKLCQNIIISGGTSMIVGFFRRIVKLF